MNTSAPTNTCRQCGGPMASNAPEGLCARCLLSVAMKDPSGESDGSDKSDAAPSANVPPSDIPDIADAAEVARRLPQFEILELLGRGGMGVVYKARQLNLDRIVALKILPPADALTPDFVERFRREARSLAKLSHPNIVSVHEIGDTGGLYFFVMEYVDGVNLRAMIREGKMKPEEALAVVPKICDALQFAHEEGVVHRDIKPENILIDKRGRVKIADFGLAKLLRREQTDNTLTMSGMTLGTPRYMAPEQMDKPETVDHRADIYSLGVVFYEMLTGEVPMGRFAPPSERVQIDVRLDEIVLHALERDADRRYQHASQVREDVEKVTSKPMAAPAFSQPEPKSEPTDGVPRAERLALVKACLVVLIISATVLIFQGLIGFATCLLKFLHFQFTDQTWYDFFLSAIVLGAGIAALGTSVKALRKGRPQMAWISALILVAATPLVEGMRRLSFVYLAPAAHFFFGALALGCFLTFRFIPQMPAAFALLAAARREKLARKNDPAERARASWFGRRSERFRTLLPPILFLLEFVFILASFASWGSPWWASVLAPDNHGGLASSNPLHKFTFLFLLLVIGGGCALLGVRLSNIDTLVRYGRRYRELRVEIRTAASRKMIRLGLAGLLAPLLITFVGYIIHETGLGSKGRVSRYEFLMGPNSKAYDELRMDMPFYSHIEHGVSHYRRPNQWEMSIALKTKSSAEPVRMEIEMPSLRANYLRRPALQFPVRIVLDADELTKWMADPGKLDVKDEKVKKEAAELMALLKQFSRKAPVETDEYVSVAEGLMPDFTFLGWTANFDAQSMNFGWLFGIWFTSTVILFALNFVVTRRIQRAAFALDREVRERGESVLPPAPVPLPRMKFSALPRDIRARTVQRAALVAVGLLVLPGAAALWEAAQPAPVEQTWHYGFKPQPIYENGVARPSPLMKHFQEVILTFTAFESYVQNGETWFVQPHPFPLEVTFCRPKNFSDKPGEFREVIPPGKGVPEGETFSFTVELPGLHANLDYISSKSSVTLDEEELLKWMEATIATTPVRPTGAQGVASRSYNKPDGTQVTLYSLPMSETPELKSLAAGLMAFLKQYAVATPTTLEAFLATAKKIPSLNGYSSTTTFHAESRAGVAVLPALAAAIVIFLALLPLLKRSAVRAAMRQGACDIPAQTAAPATGANLVAERAASEPRLSRLALWGVVLTVLPFTLLLPVRALAATIFGAVAIAQIKRSNGRLYGLRLAAFNTLFFPLIALFLFASLIFYQLITAIFEFHDFFYEEGHRIALAGLEISVFAALIVCFFAGRAAWRRIVGQSIPTVQFVGKKSTARRFLGLRFWVWPLASALLIAAAIYVPRPGNLSEPKESAQILEPQMFIAPEGGTYRFITWDQTPKFNSVYTVMKATIINQTTTRKIGWDGEGLSLGFFHRKGSWRPQLSPQPIGKDARTEPSLVNGIITWMEQPEIDKVLPLVVAELNKREAGRGARFQEMLRDGVAADSYVCWQNLVVLLAWLSLPIAVLALAWRLREIFVAFAGALAGALATMWAILFLTHALPEWFHVLYRSAELLTAIATSGVVVLLFLHRKERPAGVRAAAPEFTLILLGMGAGALQWTGTWGDIPGWYFWHGAAFSLIYVALGLLMLVIGGSRRGTGLAAQANILAGVFALACALVCAIWPPKVPYQWGNGAPELKAVHISSGLFYALTIAIITAALGAVQLRESHARKSQA